MLPMPLRDRSTVPAGLVMRSAPNLIGPRAARLKALPDHVLEGRQVEGLRHEKIGPRGDRGFRMLRL